MIELRNVTKSYPTPHGRRYVFKDLNFRFPDDVSIGLIGPNGAGKSTLMRLLGGIDSPDRGSVISDVNISWPVGLSGGMQTSLTGRDNVRFVCRLYGATGAVMREKVRYVEEFAEIGEYFDLPMRSYSSGMRSRVAFGLSMAFDFDYYLIDEMMAVGDATFKAKSQKVFQTRLENANLILVSHNMADIRQLCDVVVFVKDGTATLFEDVEAGIVAYQGGVPTVEAARRKRKRAVVARAAEPATAVPETSAPANANELATQAA
jgi:capsular polysaccharide transport system ATP-binding protein